MKTILFILGTLIFAGCSVFGIRTSEEPSFNVLREQGDIQIRQYNDMLIAETEVAADYDESSSIGFRRLAGFIFGKNSKKQEIKMTAPVVQEKNSEKIAMTAPVLQKRSDNKWVMAFVLPSAYTLDTLPEPLDEKVVIKKIPGKRVASLRFTGFLSETNLREKSDQLKAWLMENDYAIISEPRLAGYDPPWTIPFLRRNEVLIDLK